MNRKAIKGFGRNIDEDEVPEFTDTKNEFQEFDDLPLNEKMEIFGSLNYQPVKMAMILRYDNIQSFLNIFNNINSPARMAYEKGKAKSQLKADRTLMAKIEKGDAEAIESYDLLQKNRKYDELIYECFGL